MVHRAAQAGNVGLRLVRLAGLERVVDVVAVALDVAAGIAGVSVRADERHRSRLSVGIGPGDDVAVLRADLDVLLDAQSRGGRLRSGEVPAAQRQNPKPDQEDGPTLFAHRPRSQVEVWNRTAPGTSTGKRREGI